MLDTLAQRFSAKTRLAPNGCLLWTGAVDSGGYGLLRVDRHHIRRAHIVAWFLATGDWPASGQVVRHGCDTPGCVNAGCLSIGTKLDNARDREERGRGVRPLGEEHGMAKLTNRQVSEIRRRLAGAGHGMARQLAWEYGVSDGHIGKIRSGESRSQF